MNVSEPEITSVTDLTDKELIDVVNNYNLELQVQPRTEYKKKHINRLSQNSNHFYNWIMSNVEFKYRS